MGDQASDADHGDDSLPTGFQKGLVSNEINKDSLHLGLCLAIQFLGSWSDVV